MVAHTFTPSTREAEAGGSLWVQDQPGLQSKLHDSQDYVEKPCLEKQAKKKKKSYKNRLWTIMGMLLGAGQLPGSAILWSLVFLLFFI